MDTGAHCRAVHPALYQHFDISQTRISLCGPRQQAGAWVLHATQSKLQFHPTDPNNDEFTEEIGHRTTQSQRENKQKTPKNTKRTHFFRHNQPLALVRRTTEGPNAMMHCARCSCPHCKPPSQFFFIISVLSCNWNPTRNSRHEIHAGRSAWRLLTGGT